MHYPTSKRSYVYSKRYKQRHSTPLGVASLSKYRVTINIQSILDWKSSNRYLISLMNLSILFLQPHLYQMINLNDCNKSVWHNKWPLPSQQHSINYKQNASNKIDHANNFYLFRNKWYNQKGHGEVANYFNWIHTIIFIYYIKFFDKKSQRQGLSRLDGSFRPAVAGWN